MKQHHGILVLLLTAWVLMNLAALAAVQRPANQWPETEAILALALAFGQTSLVAAHTALGRINQVPRIGLLLATALQSAYLATVATDANLPAWSSLMAIMAITTAVPLVVMRLAVGYVVRLDDPPNPAMDRWQFSIWGILSTTTGVAIACAVVRLWDFHLLGFNNIFALVLFCLTAACCSWCSVLSLLAIRSLPIACIPPVLIAGLLGLLYALTGLPPNDRWELWWMGLLQGILTMLACLVVRLAGYRLKWNWRTHQEKVVEFKESGIHYFE